MAGRYWLETLGCPKNQVDSEKLAGLLESEGYKRAGRPEKADLLVVNTCAFIEAAREESIGAVLQMAASRKDGAKLVVTGCMAERYGQELADALPEVDQVAGFGVPLTAAPSALAPSALAPSALAPSALAPSALAPSALAPSALAPPVGATVTSVPVSLSVARHGRPSPPPRAAGPNASRTAGRRAHRGADSRPVPSFDLLNLPRPRTGAPWAYVKVAEGCDRHCGFCAIPSFRGPQRSRSSSDILDEVDALGAQEVVLVAQDLVSWGRDRDAVAVAGDGFGQRPETGEGLVDLVRHVRERVQRVRLLYLYPSGLNDELIDAVGDSGCPYFDLSLQHVSRPLVKRMRRFGDGARFLGKISDIRGRFPDAALRSSFIVGYPGETEEDHDALLAFLAEAELDWVGFFAFSNEDGTYAAGLEGQVPSTLVVERIRECSEVQDAITAKRRNDLVGTRCRALVDTPGHARSHREAPEIDGVVRVPTHLPAGTWVDLQITEAVGPDLIGEPVTA